MFVVWCCPLLIDGELLTICISLLDVSNDDVKTLNFQLTPISRITIVAEQVQELVLDSLD